MGQFCSCFIESNVVIQSAELSFINFLRKTIQNPNLICEEFLVSITEGGEEYCQAGFSANRQSFALNLLGTRLARFWLCRIQNQNKAVRMGLL